MSRPALLRLTPSRLRHSLYSRFYARRHDDYPELFAKAPLVYAPGIVMHDLRPHCAISGPIAFTGSYEPRLSRRIVSLARRGGLLVDVGANMGYVSLLWVNANPDNRAIAFEPARAIFDLLSNNIAANGLADRIEARAIACCDREGSVSFDPGPADQTGWGGIKPDGGQTVEAARLDRMFDKIDLLKIDVEGADTLVLRGAEGLLREKRIGRIFFECNPTRMAELDIAQGEAIEMLEAAGYACAPMSRSGADWEAWPR